MSAEFPNQFPRYPSSFRRKRPIRPIQRPIGPIFPIETDTNLMNAELNLDWDDNINTDIWVSKKNDEFLVSFFIYFEMCVKNNQ